MRAYAHRQGQRSVYTVVIQPCRERRIVSTSTTRAQRKDHHCRSVDAVVVVVVVVAFFGTFGVFCSVARQQIPTENSNPIQEWRNRRFLRITPNNCACRKRASTHPSRRDSDWGRCLTSLLPGLLSLSSSMLPSRLYWWWWLWWWLPLWL